MYVKELKNGMLLKPKEGWEWNVNRLHETGGEGRMELSDQGVLSHCSVRYRYQNIGRPNNELGMYIGKRKLTQSYYGLFTHHIILVNGTVAAVDGYSFADVEKV